jgi:hypothetical protein
LLHRKKCRNKCRSAETYGIVERADHASSGARASEQPGIQPARVSTGMNGLSIYAMSSSPFHGLR